MLKGQLVLMHCAAAITFPLSSKDAQRASGVHALYMPTEQQQTAHLFPDIVNKAAASSIFHDEVEDVVGEVHVQEADDAGVLQARQHTDLVLDLVNLGNAAEVAGVHRLDCYCLACTMLRW